MISLKSQSIPRPMKNREISRLPLVAVRSDSSDICYDNTEVDIKGNTD